MAANCEAGLIPIFPRAESTLNWDKDSDKKLKINLF